MRKTLTKITLITGAVGLAGSLAAQCGVTSLLGSSSNMFTQIRNGTNPVAADKNLNTIIFAHRNNASVFGGSSGTLRYDISTNGGTSWTNNLGLLNPLQTNPARYPNVAIYNPTGNTTPANAYLSYVAATTGTVGWNGLVTGVRQLSGTGNTESYNQPSSSQFLIPNSLVKGAPGVFWSVDALYNGTAVTGFRIYKGTWNTSINDIQWVTNYTMSPTFNTAYDGAAHVGDYNIAFDPTGTYGWVSILTHLTPGPANYAYYPVFYKTSDGGNTWSGPIQVNLTTIPCMTSLITGTNVVSTAFEHDLTVDVKGNPHMFTTICNGNNAYAVYFGSTHHVFDITQMGGVWTGYDVANVNAGRGTWGTGTNSVTMDMAPQAGRTADGQKVFFTWTDNTTYTLGAANQSPNVFARGFDVMANKWTNVKDFSSCNGAVSGRVYFPHLAAEMLEPSASSFKLPLVYGEYTSGTDPGLAANFRFLDNCTFLSTDFSVNQATVAVSINEGMNWLLCPGYSKTLTITGSYSQVNWTNGATTNTSVVNTTGTHLVGVSNGCALGIDTFYVTGLANNPVATSSVICTGNSSTLTVTGNAYGYTFTPMGTSGTVAVVSPTATSVYSVTGMGDGACLNTKTVQVTVNPLPTISITGNNSVCIGSSVVQTAGGASTYTWNTGPTTASVSLSPTVNTTYTVTGTDVNGCVNLTSKTISVNPLPNVIITGTNQGCSGAPANLVASGALTYTWNTGATTASIAPTPTSAVNSGTSFIVTGTDANGCVNSASKGYTIWALPTPTAAVNPACVGDALIFGGTSAVTYSWSGPAFTSNLATPTIAPASLANAGTYTYAITDMNGCTGMTTLSATVNPLPSISITGASTVCGGNPIVQTASGANTYSWNTGATTNSISATPLVSTTYSVIGTDANGCSGTASAFITVYDPPSVIIAGNNPICFGAATTQSVSGANTYTWSTSANTTTITVSPTVSTTYTVIGEDTFGCTNTASVNVVVNALPTLTITGANTICNGTGVTQTVGGASTYTWSTGANTTTVLLTPTVNATYTVDGTDANGCSNSSVISITVNALPTISVSTSNSLICPFNSVSLTSSGANTYTWNPGGLNGSVISVTPNVTTSYTVMGTDANGCENSAILTQSVATCTGIQNVAAMNGINVYPNPNNGSFKIELSENAELTEVIIINALGQQVFIQPLLSGANTIEAKQLAKGVYQYIITQNRYPVTSGKLIIE